MSRLSASTESESKQKGTDAGSDKLCASVRIREKAKGVIHKELQPV